ncbi:YceI family protein [Nigerium massiliense]|uniref:YceI family protein n=1 Tax=Nigerium massiliense TaxID=1522317 RepID=UPI00058F2733|nr:YceI family protein [Nigerium massiliense]
MSELSQLKGTFELDPTHTTLGFVTRHAMVTKVRGSFNEFSGSATVDGENPSSSSLEVVVKAASMDTRNADRDAHLRSGDFFEVENYPEIRFVGTDFKVVDDETVEVTGDLTIKDTTNTLTIPFQFGGVAQDPFGNTRVGFEGRTQILRSEFGLTWNAALETGGFLVSDKVTLELEVSAIKKA